jgi:hypothetical protein
VEHEEVPNKGKTSAENLNVQTLTCRDITISNWARLRRH